ncbi:hypothetical protein XELAEV_18031903mg [Xenopus laevis]|uniref:Uncharacterized protein n=1 Tax=Xenopus laevis TaxID=8355 RepID=A0A974CNW6_XENLA|nr:hypothetical protein XELAEV_18031903mg [Xenopus laevis]
MLFSIYLFLFHRVITNDIHSTRYTNEMYGLVILFFTETRREVSLIIVCQARVSQWEQTVIVLEQRTAVIAELIRSPADNPATVSLNIAIYSYEVLVSSHSLLAIGKARLTQANSKHMLRSNIILSFNSSYELHRITYELSMPQSLLCPPSDPTIGLFSSFLCNEYAITLCGAGYTFH